MSLSGLVEAQRRVLCIINFFIFFSDIAMVAESSPNGKQKPSRCLHSSKFPWIDVGGKVGALRVE